MKTSKAVIICIYLLCNTFILFLPVSKVSAEQDIKNTIDDYMKNFLEEHRIPGASMALVHENEVVFSKAWGVTGESEERVTTETPFTLGSISKSLTGLAIIKLMEEGKVELEDPVQTYLPWFTLEDPKATAQITIKHLLTHSSGISTYSGLLIADKESKDGSAIQKNVESLSNVKLTASPGEKYQYSNANFLILGALIEEVTNQTYSDYMEQQVFLPLGMHHAAADNDRAYEKGYSAGYQSWFGIPRKSSVTYDNGGAPYGYITASAEDMVQYIKFLGQQHNRRFLTEHNMKLYLSPLFQTAENRYYGFGLRITNPESKDKMIWHSGSTPDSHTEMFFIPETGWGGVILTNKNHILEEAALPQLKQGIINIVNGEEPVAVPTYTPIVQLMTIAMICLLFVMSIYLLLKVKSVIIQKKKAWRSLGVILIVLAVIMIPLLTHGTGSPWHTIRVFAPDVALLAIITAILLASNGLLSILISLKGRLSIKEETIPQIK